MVVFSKTKKKRGTAMLMEKRSIHDMEVILQTVIESDARCNEMAKLLVASGVVDKESLEVICLDFPSKLSKDFGFSPTEIEDLMVQIGPIGSGSRHDLIEVMEQRIRLVQNLLSDVITTESQTRTYARQMVASGINSRDEICRICEDKPAKLRDFGFSLLEIDMMVAYFSPPPLLDLNSRNVTVTPEDVATYAADIDTLLRPVIAAEGRRRAYANQMAMSGLCSREDIFGLCNNKPMKMRDFGFSDSEVDTMIAHFNSPADPATPPYVANIPSFGEAFAERMYSVFGVKPRCQSQGGTPGTVEEFPPVPDLTFECDENSVVDSVTYEAVESRCDRESAASFNFGILRGDSMEFGYTNPLNKGVCRITKGDVVSLRAAADAAIQQTICNIPSVSIHWGRNSCTSIAADTTQREMNGSCDNSAFMFIKPHANVSSDVCSLVRNMLFARRIHVLEEGDICADRIDSERLIDQHYYAIGSKAVLLKPSQLDVPADKFEAIFHVSWSSVVQQNLAFNAMDACSHLGLDADGLDKAWGAAKDAGKLVKLGGGFYCGLIDTVPGKGGVYVINGFYMAMRAKFVSPGSSVHYFNVEWRSSDLSFADFRNKVLGSTDPHFAPADSIRGCILAEWKHLGLASVPNTGDNGVHASASPFEALAERMNWLKLPVAEDIFGRKLLGVGVTAEAISTWCCDPVVNGVSIFDTLEGLNCGECIAKALVAYSVSMPPAATARESVVSAGMGGLKGRPSFVGRDSSNCRKSLRRSTASNVTWMIEETDSLVTRIHSEDCDNSAFMFIKPHANVSSDVCSLVRNMLFARRIHVLEEGDICADRIDSERLIDQHYYAIGSKAVLLKPSQLDVPADKFEAIFHVSWSSVVQQNLAFNAMDACSHLGLDADGLDKAWGAAKDAGKLVKLGGGFYCGLIDTVPGKGGVYVINGFYMAMRAKFVSPGSSVHYFNVEWRSSDLSFADFRNKVLGSTDPHFAPADSIRGCILAEWKHLGLASVPNTGDNGVHASASPFEALAERMNWLKLPVAEDIFGRKLLGVGISESLLQAAILNPQVGDEALFDVMEELEGPRCITTALELSALYSSLLINSTKMSAEGSMAEKIVSIPVDGDGVVDYVTLEDGCQVHRRMTCTESEIMIRKNRSQSIIDSLTDANDVPLPSMSAYIPQVLSEAIFCGHLVTDLDSIAAAIAAAELYGGVAARASEINSETQFVLLYWGLPPPLPIEVIVETQPNAEICLVDHQQMSQVHSAIDPDRIVGVIDHHALQNATIITDRPIVMDIRPWGSSATIVSHTYIMSKKRPRKCIAGILLCAILSDTLNLKGPTTTEWDKTMAGVLAEIAGVKDIEALATAQFKAKSKDLESLTGYQLCEGDMKVFSYSTPCFRGSVGFAVVETTDDGVVLSRVAELSNSLLDSKEEKALEVIFLAVVNIVELHSTLLVIGENENSLAEAAFKTAPGRINGDRRLFSLGNLVSRKKDFIPAVSNAINKGGWKICEG